MLEIFIKLRGKSVTVTKVKKKTRTQDRRRRTELKYVDAWWTVGVRVQSDDAI